MDQKGKSDHDNENKIAAHNTPPFIKKFNQIQRAARSNMISELKS